MTIKEIKIVINTDTTLQHKHSLTPVGVRGISTSITVPAEYIGNLAKRLNVTSASEVRKRLVGVWHSVDGLENGLLITFEEKTPQKNKTKKPAKTF